MGHYLIDQIYGAGMTASVPEARDGKATPRLMGGSALVPRFRNHRHQGDKEFHPRLLPSMSSVAWAAWTQRNFAAYGEELQKKLESYARQRLLDRHHGRSPAALRKPRQHRQEVVDAWGIPVLHIQTKYTDNEFNMARDAVDTSMRWPKPPASKSSPKTTNPNPPGYSIHELGTCRMGDNPKTSVLNKWNQSHDIKNLFVVDGSSFVSSGWQNPTMTLTALSMRASEYLAEQMRQGNV